MDTMQLSLEGDSKKGMFSFYFGCPITLSPSLSISPLFSVWLCKPSWGLLRMASISFLEFFLYGKPWFGKEIMENFFILLCNCPDGQELFPLWRKTFAKFLFMISCLTSTLWQQWEQDFKHEDKMYVCRCLGSRGVIVQMTQITYCNDTVTCMILSWLALDAFLWRGWSVTELTELTSNSCPCRQLAVPGSPACLAKEFCDSILSRWASPVDGKLNIRGKVILTSSSHLRWLSWTMFLNETDLFTGEAFACWWVALYCPKLSYPYKVWQQLHDRFQVVDKSHKQTILLHCCFAVNIP